MRPHRTSSKNVDYAAIERTPESVCTFIYFVYLNDQRIFEYTYMKIIDIAHLLLYFLLFYCSN